MARKHNKSISFYLSEEDYISIKEAAITNRMTMKDYLIYAHNVTMSQKNKLSDSHLQNTKFTEKQSGDPSIHLKLDEILDKVTSIQNNSMIGYKINKSPIDNHEELVIYPPKLIEFLDEQRTERQRKNAIKIYELLMKYAEQGISLMQARDITSSTAKKTLDGMIDAGVVMIRGRRYYLPT